MPESSGNLRSGLRRAALWCAILWFCIVNILFFSTRVKDSAVVHTFWRKTAAVWSH